jgi:hypothetical protein
MQRFVAKRKSASSHVPILSQADLVINVIRTATEALQGATATA